MITIMIQRYTLLVVSIRFMYILQIMEFLGDTAVIQTLMDFIKTAVLILHSMDYGVSV